MTILNLTPATDAELGAAAQAPRTTPSPAAQGGAALPTDPIFRAASRDAGLILLRRIAGGRCDECRAGVYTRFLPPLAIVYDEPTGCAWLCSVSLDGRLATVEATAVWGQPCDVRGCERTDTVQHLLAGRREVWLCSVHLEEVRS